MSRAVVSRGRSGTHRATRFELVAVALAQNVELEIEHRHHFVGLLFRDVGVRLAPAVADVDCTRPGQPKAAPFGNGGCVLGQTNAEEPRVLRDRANESSRSAPLR